MRRFAARTIALCLVIGVLIGSVVWYNRASAGPNPLHAYGLDICDGRACLFGIAPGFTSWNDARTEMMHHASQAPDETHLVLSMGNAEFRVMTYNNEAPSPVKSIYGDIPPDSDFPRLGSFFVQYGMPCGVAIGDHSGLLELRYPSFDLNVNIGDQDRIDGLTVNSSIVYMTLIDPIPGMCAAEHLCPAVLPWLGYQSLSYYRAHGLPLSRRSCDFIGQ